MSANSAHTPRIIAGTHRGRRLSVANREGLRPTPSRVRETVFNWLQGELSGAVVLDAFAGSGIMGLEALSRGAKWVEFCEKHSQSAAALKNTLINWRIAHQARVVNTNALLLTPPQAPYDFIVIDPPFAAHLHQQALNKFATAHWLKSTGYLYIEYAHGVELQLPSGYVWQKKSRAGQVAFALIGLAHE